MLIIVKRVSGDTPASDKLILPFEARRKSRLRARTENGEDCGLLLERGMVLRGGDRLAADDGRVIEIVAAAEALMEAASNNPLLLARAAYHLGNRHVAVEITPGRLRFAADRVLGEMLRGLGLEVAETQAPLEPENGAYRAYATRTRSHGHNHEGDEGEDHGPRCHEGHGEP